MSLPELSNQEIIIADKKDATFGGCCSRDDLPLPLNNKYYIVNLDSRKGPGTHWVLLDNRRPLECFYFDSYGMPPPESVKKLMLHTNKKLAYNDADLQALGSQQCGWWCEYIADELGDGHDFKKVVAFAQHHPNPDKYLEGVFKDGKTLPAKFNKSALLQEHLKEGSGIFDFVKRRIHFKPRNGATKRFNNFLNSEGDKDIVSIKFGREPVKSGVTTALNILSLGKLDKAKEKLNYKDIYHNYLIVTLSDGNAFRIEKNHVVEATPYSEGKEKNGFSKLLYDIPLSKHVNLKTLINKAEKDNSTFWNYNPESNNCQAFVKNIVDKNELDTHHDQELTDALKPQDSKQLIGVLPKSLQSFPKTITDFAGIADRVLHGDGITKGTKRKRGK